MLSIVTGERFPPSAMQTPGGNIYSFFVVQVFDSSGAEVLATAIPISQVHMLDKCGHFIAFERPKKSAKLILEFYNSVCDKAETKKVA